MLLKSVWILIAMLSISDPTLRTDSVAEVMELMNKWSSLYSILYITKTVVPDSRLTEIQQRCSTKREIANECASYYVHYHPQPSWTHLASQLYRRGEFAAVEKLKPFLPLRGKCQAISKQTMYPIPTVCLCMYFDGYCLGAQNRLAHVRNYFSS